MNDKKAAIPNLSGVNPSDSSPIARLSLAMVEVQKLTSILQQHVDTLYQNQSNFQRNVSVFLQQLQKQVADLTPAKVSEALKESAPAESVASAPEAASQTA